MTCANEYIRGDVNSLRAIFSMQGKKSMTNRCNVQFRQKHSIRFLCILAIAVIAFFSCTSISSAGPDDFPAPTWLKKVTVSEHMVINGLTSSVQYFESHRRIDELMRFYRGLWNEDGNEKKDYREITVEPWHILSRLDGRYLYTVQAQQISAFKINGYLSVADLKASANKKDIVPDPPKLNGSRVINYTRTRDPGKKGSTMIIANTFSISSNAEYYRNYYGERGWSKQVDMESNEARVLTFKRFGKETHLVINHLYGTTQIVMNTVEHE